MTGDQSDAPLLTPRFSAALEFARKAHSRQVRKGSGTPYLAHLMSVAALVLEQGGDEDTAIAALLHDVAEDQGGREALTDIESRFGSRVANIVAECSDTFETPKPPWRERKEAYLRELASASPQALLVSRCDKLHNARSIIDELRREGATVWARFKGGRDGTLWYYRALLEAYSSGAAIAGVTPADDWMLAELRRVVDQMHELA